MSEQDSTMHFLDFQSSITFVFTLLKTCDADHSYCNIPITINHYQKSFSFEKKKLKIFTKSNPTNSRF